MLFLLAWFPFLSVQLSFVFLFVFICSVCICHPWVAQVSNVHAGCLSTRFTYSVCIGFLIWHMDCSVSLVLLSSIDCLICWYFVCVDGIVLSQLAFWLPSVCFTCPVSTAMLSMSCFLGLQFTSLVHIAVGSLNLHLAHSICVWLIQSVFGSLKFW